MHMGFRIPRATKRANDMPLHGRVMRERKGVYVCIISFTQTKRHYGDEIVYATSVKQVKAHLNKMYPTLAFGKRNPIAKEVRTPKYKPRVVASKRVYKRKPRTNSGE